LQDRILVFVETVVEQLDCGRKGARAVDLRTGGGVFGRKGAWLLFGIAGDKGIGMRVGSFGSVFVVDGEDFGCECEVGAV
jgi:hypothetical protein